MYQNEKTVESGNVKEAERSNFLTFAPSDFQITDIR